LIVHHLVVDGVSWRILLPDLAEAWHTVANLRTGRRRYRLSPWAYGRVSGPRAREISPVSVHTQLTSVRIRGRADPAKS
ncbi:hypothetical protein, partial [Streptomyces badius]